LKFRVGGLSLVGFFFDWHDVEEGAGWCGR
jgi:hypothetical protein